MELSAENTLDPFLHLSFHVHTIVLLLLCCRFKLVFCPGISFTAISVDQQV